MLILEGGYDFCPNAFSGSEPIPGPLCPGEARLQGKVVSVVMATIIRKRNNAFWIMSPSESSDRHG